ncbi:hypothetical protein OAV88_03115 [bacterium]|nr:hypothetical protein [bacterium]
MTRNQPWFEEALKEITLNSKCESVVRKKIYNGWMTTTTSS